MRAVSWARAAVNKERARFSSRLHKRSAIVHWARMRFDGECRLLTCSASDSIKSSAFFSVAGSIFAGEGAGDGVDGPMTACAWPKLGRKRIAADRSKDRERNMMNFLSFRRRGRSMFIRLSLRERSINDEPAK